MHCSKFTKKYFLKYNNTLKGSRYLVLIQSGQFVECITKVYEKYLIFFTGLISKGPSWHRTFLVDITTQGTAQLFDVI